MLFVRQYIRPHRKLLLGILLLAVINQVFSLLDPQVFRWMTDTYLVNYMTIPADEFLHGVFLGMLGLAGVAMVSRIAKNFQDYYVNVMTQNIGLHIYQNTLTHALSLPYGLLEDQQSGQLIQKLTKARTDIQTFVTILINAAFLSVIAVLFVIVYAFTVHWMIGAIFVSVIPVMVGTMMLLSKRIKQSQDAIVSQSASLAGVTTETIRNISLIKMLGLGKQEIHRLEDANQQILALELRKIKTVRTLEFLQGTMINAVRVGLIGAMFWMIFHGRVSVGEFFSLFFYSFYVFGGLAQFGNVVKQYQEAKASHEVLEDIMKMEQEPVVANPLDLGKITSLTFDHVSFGYGDESVLHDISRTVSQGKTIAFVGPSGSGKSTILKLLAGLYRPQQGKIFVNDNDLSLMDVSLFAQQLGIVSQDSQLFAGSIIDNLRFVSPNASEDDCRNVLGQAQLDQFVRDLPEGIHTQIGEGGLKLSGGQKQRLAIARALLRKPRVLLFDEATSALDSIVEKEITDTVSDIAGHKNDFITILVAHRLSTVMRADMIFVLEKGNIVESGTHEALIEGKGLYYALWRQQG